MRDAERIVEVLKQVLKERGLTYAQLGERIGLSESTVKRMFSQRRMTLDRLETICDVVGLSVLELTRRASAQREAEVYRLTIAQERKLVADVELFYFFWMLVNRHSLRSITRRYGVSEETVQRWLVQLDRMGIIELREGGRFSLRVSSNVVWNEDGPSSGSSSRARCRCSSAAASGARTSTAASSSASSRPSRWPCFAPGSSSSSSRCSASPWAPMRCARTPRPPPAWLPSGPLASRSRTSQTDERVLKPEPSGEPARSC